MSAIDGLLTVEAVCQFEGLSRREVYNRMGDGTLSTVLAENPGRGPKKIRLIDGRSMTQAGRDRWLRSVGRERMEKSEFFGIRGSGLGVREVQAPSPQPPTPNPEPPPTPNPAIHQGDLFLSPVAERLPGEYEQKRVAERRLRLIEPVANGKFRTMGFSTKGDYLRATASASKTSVRTLQRWWDDYRAAGGGVRGLEALMQDKPGPQATGPRLEEWQKLFLTESRLVGHLTREAAYDALLAELARRQAAWGEAHIYQQPTRSTAYRYWASLSAQAPVAAALEGRSAVKAAGMQISRTYADCHSLDRVGTDEWITDVFTYNPGRLLKNGRPYVGRAYLVTMLDERSLYPLDAVLVDFPDVEDEIDLLVKVCLDYGVPGLINSDRGRFRGKAFGGRFQEFDRAKALDRTQGILDQLNIGRNMPREHNPQGNRLERFHLEIARFCRTLPGWCGNSPTEKDELSNAEAALAAHERWVKGIRGSGFGVREGSVSPTPNPQSKTPLLSQDELLTKIKEFFAWWRNEHYSEGTDMNSLTPQMVFDRERPPQGFRTVSPEHLDAVTVRVWTDKIVKPGGVIEIAEGDYQSTRYYSHELVLIQGERRTVTRSRYDRSRITVHGRDAQDPPIIAPAMPRVGVADPELLGRAIGEKKFSQELLRTALEAGVRGSGLGVGEERTISSSEVMMGQLPNPQSPIPALSPTRPPRSRERLEREVAAPPVTSEDVARRALEMEMEG